MPFFALVLIGFGAGKSRVLSEAQVSGVNRFVYLFALPPLLFLVMSRAPFAEVMAQGLFLVGHLGAGLIVFVPAWLLAHLVMRRTKAEASVFALGSSYGNIGFMGIPLLVAVMGEWIAVPLGLMVLLDVAFFIPLSTLLIDLTADGPERKKLGPALAQSVLKNPLVISILLGLAFAATGWPLPEPLARLFSILGQAAAPGAMFALGAVLAGRPVSEGVLDFSAITTFKLFVHPLVMWWLMGALDVAETWRLAAALGAAMPVAASVFVIAQEYKSMPARASSAILASTGLSMISLTALIAWTH